MLSFHVRFWTISIQINRYADKFSWNLSFFLKEQVLLSLRMCFPDGETEDLFQVRRCKKKKSDVLITED